MKLSLETKIVKNFSLKEKKLVQSWRIREWGKDGIADFDSLYESETIFLFLKNEAKVVSFVGLRPIMINYLGKKYKIFGICSLISNPKGVGYGRVLISGLILYLKKNNKSAIGFTGRAEFFRKAGLKVVDGLIKRFVYIDPKTNKKIIDEDGDGICYNGKDNLVKKILSTKSIVYINKSYW